MDTQGLLFSLAEILTGSKLEPLPVRRAVDLAIESKRNRGLRHRYILKLSSALGLFSDKFGERELHSLKPVEIEDWLQNPGWSNETRKGYLQCVRTLFSFGVKRGWCFHNAAMRVDAPMSESESPGILTVDHCAALLSAALETDRALVPFLAVQLFAGLRNVEARAISWEQMACGSVDVQAAKCKTRKRRLIPISPQLRAWLDVGGDLPVKGWRKRLDKVRRASGVPWPTNCLRHSFVSYMMPLHGATTVAAWAGHSESTLFNHYRAIVTEVDAKRFSELVPTAQFFSIKPQLKTP